MMRQAVDLDAWRGFEGWMLVSFSIVALFLALGRPALVARPDARAARWAAIAPVLVYALQMAFQVAVSQPVALRFIAFFAMGMPAMVAAVAWWHWRAPPRLCMTTHRAN